LKDWQIDKIKQSLSPYEEFTLVWDKLSAIRTTWDLDNLALQKTRLTCRFHCNELITCLIIICKVLVLISSKPIEFLVLAHN
jgi:hypothetical protein